MIPSRPPPTFKDASRWTSTLNDFVSKCLVKNPDARATATELLHVSLVSIDRLLSLFVVLVKHEFILHVNDMSVLQQMIDEVREIQEQNPSSQLCNTIYNKSNTFTERALVNDSTLTNHHRQEATIVPEHQQQRLVHTQVNRIDTETDTFQSSSCNTMIELSSESSDTMIINEHGTETENDDDSQQDTLKVSRT
jgi:serine/threonine protein kinase